MMIVIFLLFFHVTPSFTVDICEAGCSCGEIDYIGRREYVVNCTNVGFKDTTVLQYLPDATQVLIFVGNDIPELPANIFGMNVNNSNLKVIDMSNNKIKEIHGKAYHKVPKVERLILNHNDLAIASKNVIYHHPRVFSNFEDLLELHLTNAFTENSPEDLAKNLHDIFVGSGLNKLRKLHLEQNEIKYFKDNVLFCALPSLMDLHLGDNKLERIDFRLNCLHHLRFLDLERNAIVYLSKEELSALDVFPQRKQNLTIDLSGNPFTCGYQIEELYTWLQNTSVEVRNKNKLKCKHESKELESVLMDFYGSHCLTSHPVNSVRLETTTSAAVPLLSIALLISVCLLIYTNRIPIKNTSLPILYSLSRKVHYTTIGKPETQEMEV